MNKSLIVGVVSIALLGSSMITQADDHGWGNYRGSNPYSHQHMSRERSFESHRNDFDRRDDQGYYRYRNYGAHHDRENVYYGHRYNQHWRYRVGDRLPDYYRNSYYYVNDWCGYHLYEPPRGYGWANIDGNFVLVALASGIIAQVLLNGGY